MHSVFLPHYLTNRTTFGGGGILQLKSVFYCLHNFVSNISHSKKIKIGIIINVIRADRPWGHPAPFTTGTGSLFQGLKGRGVALTNQPHLAPKLKKEYSYTSTPPLGLRGLFYGEFTLTCFFISATLHSTCDKN